MYKDELYHHGILGMKWGVRRYQNKDGSLTPAGRQRLKSLQGAARYSLRKAHHAHSTMTEIDSRVEKFKKNYDNGKNAEKILHDYIGNDWQDVWRSVASEEMYGYGDNEVKDYKTFAKDLYDSVVNGSSAIRAEYEYDAVQWLSRADIFLNARVDTVDDRTLHEAENYCNKFMKEVGDFKIDEDAYKLLLQKKNKDLDSRKKGKH